MRKDFLIIVLFAAVLAACSGASRPAKVVSLAEGIDLPKESADNDCSYFYFMWGRTAELEEKLDEAREAYEKALVCDMHAVHIMKRLAVLLIKMDKKRDAVAWMKRMVGKPLGSKPAGKIWGAW